MKDITIDALVVELGNMKYGCKEFFYYSKSTINISLIKQINRYTNPLFYLVSIVWTMNL